VPCSVLLNVVALGALFVNNEEIRAQGRALEAFVRTTVWSAVRMSISAANVGRSA